MLSSFKDKSSSSANYALQFYKRIPICNSILEMEITQRRPHLFWDILDGNNVGLFSARDPRVRKKAKVLILTFKE